jgi:hypothetical protein
MRELRNHNPRGLPPSLLTPLLTLCLAGVLSTSWLLDDFAEAHTRQQVAEDWAQFEADAQTFCGEGVAWALLPNGLVQCHVTPVNKRKVRML